MRKLRIKPNAIYFRLIAVITFLIGLAVFSFWTKEDKTPRAIYVKVPPLVDFNTLSDEQIIQYRADYILSPTEIDNIDERNLSGTWERHVLGTVGVRLNSNGKLFRNGEAMGDTKDTFYLESDLSRIMRERTKNKYYAENSLEIDKKVVVTASHSVKYGEILKVIDVVKASGANPIILDVEYPLKDF